MSEHLRVYLVDDEPLALRRLTRLLSASGRAEIIGSSTDPEKALAQLAHQPLDLLFLDIQMPALSGFELWNRLESQPPVIFTTAFDRYALQAFAVHTIDYLLKPVGAETLERALDKFERLRGTMLPQQLQLVNKQLAAALRPQSAVYAERFAVRLGDKVQLVELSEVTHFCARDKLTYAVTAHRQYPVQDTLGELEQKLDTQRFVRIYRSILVNVAYVQEVHGWFSGRLLVRLKDEKRTELPVARDRVQRLKAVLNF